ncbi:MAG: hypothetical protein JW779_04890, partial [Candidatus Thorarchaeota archaeon]|nr:hypothetical protein [Candidatus Thorarchaeota archaeon]
DYKNTFAPVARYETIRLLLALKATMSMHIAQFDIKTAFLHADLEEEVYMKQPPGFQQPGGKVCFLKKSLYGLCQAPSSFFCLLRDYLLGIGYRKSDYDNCLFIKRDKLKNGEIALTLVAWYVDDGLAISTNLDELKKLSSKLEKKFTLKENWDVKHFLGMDIEITKDYVQIGQLTYINDVLKQFGMTDYRTQHIPIHQKLDFNPENVPDQYKRRDFPYQKLVGHLLFLARITRPDITFALQQLTRYFSNFDERHWKAAKNLLRYVANTKNYTIRYYQSSYMDLELQCDSNFAKNADKAKSISGWLSTFNGNPLTWSSKQQTLIAQSTAEAELYAINTATREGVWLHHLLCDIGVRSWKTQIVIYSDSTSGTKIAENDANRERTKHMEPRVYYVRDLVEKKLVSIKY